MNKKRKHSGFTLVEVLVAAAILSIMVPPILSSFVAIARVNSKSRMKLSATTIANGVMESVKGFELSQIAKECDYPGEGFHIIAGFTGTAAEVSPTSLSALAGPDKTIQKDGDGTPIFNASASGDYAFVFNGVSMDGTTYDVLLTYKKNVTTTNADVTYSTGGVGSTVITKTTAEILGPLSVRVLTYYDVDIKVFRGGAGTTSTPLAHITGTKADYN